MYDIVIIGAGVIGCAVAYRLGQYEGKFAVMDFAHDVSEGASKANSGIVHAGYDAKAGTEKARLNVKGARMMKDLCRTLGVPYGQPGALVLGFHEEDRKALEALYENAKVNGVRYDTPAGAEATLNTDLYNEDILVQVCHADTGSIELTYTVHVQKSDPIQLTIQTTPAEAICIDNGGFWI